MPNPGLELMEEFITLNLIKVILVCFSREHLDAIIQLLAEVLGSGLLQSAEPQLHLLTTLVD